MSVLGSYVAVLVVVLLFAGCEHLRAEKAAHALAERNSQIDAEVERRRAEVAEWVLAASARREEVDRKVEARQAEVRTVTREIVREIPTYVTSFADSHGWVTRGFVRVHDAAAAGKALPVGPVELVDAPGGVAPSAVAETVVANYGTCLAWREQVIGWQEWYSGERGRWNGKPAG